MDEERAAVHEALKQGEPAIAVIGGLAISVLFSLVVTPVVFYALRRLTAPRPEADEGPESAGLAIPVTAEGDLA